jgi:hypothetical protein
MLLRPNYARIYRMSTHTVSTCKARQNIRQPLQIYIQTEYRAKVQYAPGTSITPLLNAAGKKRVQEVLGTLFEQWIQRC